MNLHKIARARIAFALLLGLVGFAPAASAATFTVYVDSDNDISTGCLSGAFSGIEQILVTTVDSTPQVTAVQQQTCSSGVFGPLTSLTPPPPAWPVGTAVSPDGPSVVETYLPFTPVAPAIRLYVASDSDSTPPPSDTLTATEGGGPIVFGLGFNPEIPTLGEWGLLVLALVLAGAAVLMLRRRQRIVFLLLLLLAGGATAAWAAIVLDGQIADWGGDAPVATDPFGSDPSPDLRALFVRFEAGRLYFRIDTSLNDPPVVTTTGGSTAFTEDGGPVVVDAGVTVTDDGANLASATVTITNPQDGPAETLAATICPGLTVTPGLNSLSITGSQPVATYQTCLQSVTFNDSSQNPGITPRMISFVANDGGVNSAPANKTVTVTPVNDAPVVTTTAGNTSFLEDGPPVVVDAGVTVTDVDNANLASATVTITNPQDGAAEVLAATSCAGLTVTPGLNSLSITGSQPLASYQTCLQSVTYDNTSNSPGTANRIVSFVANDGTASSAAANKTVTVAPAPDAPVVTTTAGSTAFTEDGPAVVVDAGVTVTDPDDTNLESAMVSLTSAPDGAAEVLNATACVGLTVTPGNPLTITGSQPIATYQTCLQSVTYNNTDQNPDTANRTVNFVANDGDNNSNTASKTVTVAAVNDAPVVTTTGGNTAFTEDGPAVVVDAGVTVTDVDNANLASATVTITNPQDGAAEVLGATSCGGITVTPGLNSLSLTGSQPIATYQTCLQSVTYNNTDQDPNTTPRVISFVANDGTANSTPANKTVTVAVVEDAPVVTTTGGNTAFTEDGPAVLVDAGVTLTDADDPNLASATVTITNPQDGAAEVLAATSCGGITVTPGVNSLSLTGSFPVATYQTCLQSVTYNNTDQDPGTTPRVISFVANDGTANSTPANKTVTVAVSNDAPVVTTTGGNTAFTEDGPAVTVDAGVTVTDVDNANLASATVTITNPQDGAAEVLAATSCPGITVTPGLNSLSLIGSQPLATYQTCLQSVTYNNTDQDPGTPPRVISFVANDGTANSTPATKTVTVAAVNDAPVVTTTVGNTAFTEDGPAVVVDAGVTVTDVDNANLASATVTITNPQDGAAETLAATSCAGLTVTPGLNSLSITGSQPPATYQTCLQSVTYNNTDQDPGTTPRSISFVANDGAASSTPATKTVTVAAVNDAPVVTTTAGNTAFTEDGPAVTVDAGVTVTDVDSANLASATVTITNPQDGAAEVLGATSCAGLTVTPGLNSLSVTGSQPPATYQTCLQSVTYNNTSQNPNTTPRVISFVANDGAASSTPATKTVTVAAVADAPVVTTTGGTTSFTEDGPAVTVDGGVTVTDVDSANLASATVTITNPQDGAAEVLGATSCGGITVTPGLNSLSLTGSFPLATYQACLQSVTYNNTDQDPGTTPRSISFVANDGAASSTPATKTVTVAAINDAPVVTTTGGTTGFTEDAGAVTVDAGVTVTDVDNANLASATVTITNPQDGAAEVLGATSCAGLTVTPGLNTLSIAGSQPVAIYQTCLQSVTYNNSSQNPNATNRVVSFVVNDGAVSSTAANKTVTVTPVPDAPVADDETFDTIGNTELRVDLAAGSTPNVPTTTASTFGVLDGDTDVDTPFASLVVSGVVGCGDTTAPFVCATVNGGEVTLESNGRFSFIPNDGDTAASDSFQYTVSDGATSDTGLVTINRKERVWYVKNDAAAGGLGRSTDPFDTLVEAQTASLVNDYIFVYFGDGTTTDQGAGILLKNGQHLIGEFAGLTVAVPGPGTFNGTPLPTNVGLIAQPGGTACGGNPCRPFLDDTVAGAPEGVAATDAIPTEIVGLNLAGNVNGIDLTTAAAFAGSGTLEIRDNVIRSTGIEGMDVNLAGTGSVNLKIHDNNVTAGVRGIDVLRTAGTATISAFDDNVVTGNTGGSGIEITGVTFDTTPGIPINQVSGGVTVIGQSGNGVSTNGMLLTSVVGDLAFTDLDIFNDAGAGLGVTSTGALNAGAGTGFRIGVAAGVSTIDSNGGPAVSVNNASITLPINFLRSTSSTTTGLSLVSAFGGVGSTALSAGSGQIADPGGASGTAVNISGGNGNITLGIPIINNSGNAVVVTGRGSDTVAFTGAITETGSGISLTTNGGATMSFRGGLSATTGSSAAFTATGGGIVEVCDENPCNSGATGLLVNTLTTTTGTALNVANTTVSANNLEFQSISAGTAASGPASGIVLNNTGSLGGLRVKGTGAAGTGGTIQRTTSTGISLTSTMNFSASFMNVNNSGDDGINGSSVNGFSLISCSLADNGNGVVDEGVELNNPTGTLTFTNTNVTRSFHNNVKIDMNNVNVTALNVTGGSITNNKVSGSGANGLLLTVRGTSTLGTSVVSGTTFTDTVVSQLKVDADNTATVTSFTAQNCTFNGISGNAVDFTQFGSANAVYRFINNTTITGHQSHAINVFSSSAATGGTLQARIQGNQVGNTGSAGSGSATGNGIRVLIQGRTVGTVLLDGNTVRQTPVARGIDAQFLGPTISGQPLTQSDITVTSNDVNPQDSTGFPTAAIYVAADSQGGSPVRVRSDVRLNTVPAGAAVDILPTFLIVDEVVAAAEAQLVDTAPASANCTAQLTSTNTGSASAVAGCALIAGPINTPL